jgi:hypothetical protein
MKEKHDGMTRTQVQFEAGQYERLKQLAARRGVSMAQLVREGVGALLAEAEGRDRWQDLFSIVGNYGDGTPEDVSREHDRYLDEAYGHWRDST